MGLWRGGLGREKSSDVAGEADSRCSPSCKISATERGERGWGVGGAQRLEGDCCACKVPTLGAARLCARSPVKEVPLFDAAKSGRACARASASVFECVFERERERETERVR